jgi:enoyl-CoA hydratase/carnithine racemase
MNPLPVLDDAVLDVEQRVAVLTMNRNDLRNALTGTMLVDDIVNTVQWINQCDEVSVLVLTGAGKAFSAGGNVKEMRDRIGLFSGDAGQIDTAYQQGIQRMSRAMYQLGVPAIAAVNGPAVGAGFDLACMCDMRIASRNASIGETFVNLGIIPGDGGSWFLQRLIGYQRAAELSFTGRMVTAEEALALGLFLEVVEPDQLLACSLSLARKIAAKPPLAVRKLKQLLTLAKTQGLDETLKLSAAFQGELHQTQDHIEAVLALIEKRIGTYHGR